MTGEIIGTTDELVSSTPGVASFVGGNEEDGFRHQLVISDATLPGGAEDTVGFHTQVLLTIADSPGGDEPGEVQPLWTVYTDQAGSPDNLFDDSFNPTGVTRFGNFNGGSGSQVFGAQGGGLGGFRESVLSVDMRLLSRPPVGYAYEAWLVTDDGAAVALPEVTGPPPERRSLLDADVETVPGLVTGTGILEASFRVTEDALERPFGDFVQFLVTLEPKAGIPGMGPIPTQSGTVPDRVRGGSP